jgi:type II secretion system protein C
MGFTAGFNGTLAAWAAGLTMLGVPQLSSQPLPHSALPVALLGVMVDTDAPSKSGCVVRCNYPVEREGIFRPGDRACEIAEIKEVRRDGVVIQNLVTNRLELLTFPDARPAATAHAVSTPPVPPPVLTTSDEVVTVDLPKGSVEHYMENLPDLLRSALASPRYREGPNGEKSIEGFEIAQVKESSVVEQLGLRNGDVILELNGEQLTSLATVIKLLGQTQNMPQAKMTVLRNGQKLTFVFNRK